MHFIANYALVGVTWFLFEHVKVHLVMNLLVLC